MQLCHGGIANAMQVLMLFIFIGIILFSLFVYAIACAIFRKKKPPIYPDASYATAAVVPNLAIASMIVEQLNNVGIPAKTNDLNSALSPKDSIEILVPQPELDRALSQINLFKNPN